MRRLLLALPLLAACHHAPASADLTRRDSSGVEIIVNSGIDRPFTAAVTPLDTIFDPASDTVLQGDMRGTRAQNDDRGNLYFVDGGFNDRRVVVRGTDGSTHQIGKHGGGPGEYEMVGGFAAAPDGELLVMDYAKRAFVRFGPDGAARPNLSWEGFGHGFVQNVVYADSGYAFTIDERSDSSAAVRLELLRPTDTLELVRILTPPMKGQFYESCKVSIMLPPLYFATVIWTGNADALAANAAAEYRIDVWRHGHLVRSIRRAVPPRPVTRAQAIADLGPGMPLTIGSGPPCIIPPGDLVDQRGFAPILPAVKRLSMARDGTLWVERWTLLGEPQLHDVFDPTGAYLGTITGEVPWPQTWLPDGSWIGVTPNADSLPVVVKYGVGGAIRTE